jgi:hypothetical protein
VARVPHYTAHLFTASKEDALANGLQLETLDKAQTVLVLLQKPENDRLALEAGGAVQEHGWRELEEDEKELACANAELKDWDGVKVDELGRVTEIKLFGNNWSASCRPSSGCWRHWGPLASLQAPQALTTSCPAPFRPSSGSCLLWWASTSRTSGCPDRSELSSRSR